MDRKPNILFSMSDDQRHDCMGCAGHPFIDTPAMDRLAEEGIRFANGFTAVPLCAPSRASHLTGVYPHVHMEYFYDAPFVAYPSMQCVRTATEKLIRYLKDGERDEFYDLAVDPDERQNRIDDPGCVEQVALMRKQLDIEKNRFNYVVPNLTVEYEAYQKF
jgi:hypothetical protein